MDYLREHCRLLCLFLLRLHVSHCNVTPILGLRTYSAKAIVVNVTQVKKYKNCARLRQNKWLDKNRSCPNFRSWKHVYISDCLSLIFHFTLVFNYHYSKKFGQLLRYLAATQHYFYRVISNIPQNTDLLEPAKEPGSFISAHSGISPRSNNFFKQ